MALTSRTLLEPRKSPVQARAVASVDAVLEAAIQVLLQLGKERLTTTNVASRAGVSVGTLYQYFPNKSALLQAVLRRHLNEVTEEVERVCKQQKGNAPRQMVAALITAFLQVKLRDAKTSIALYSVSSDVDGAKIAQQTGVRTNKAIIAMLATASEPLSTDPHLIAFTLVGAMTGVSRRMLESGAPARQLDILGRELVSMACAYIDACTLPLAVEDIDEIQLRPARAEVTS